MRTVDQVVEDALIDEISKLLATCTEEQQSKFAKWFPDVNSYNEAKLRDLLALVQRTVQSTMVSDYDLAAYMAKVRRETADEDEKGPVF